ncbi:hypothetical protein BJ742DRAFT_672305 [Cladochytrium replicatum]|nr:hypothetical protein BJ742DRAFT_672305 [Cladochytrium replicatum]
MDSTAVVTASNTAANSGISTPWIKKYGLLTTDEIAIFTLLDNVEDIQFDIFELDRMSNHRPLHYISWYLFRKHDFLEKFKIPEAKFRHWVTKVEQGYKPTNPYHNSIHAADVTHSMHYYVTRPRVWERLNSEERLATLIAPIIHDYMHPGVNNAFLISTINPLSLRYNDQSVLEHFHCASIFELMSRDEFNILSSLTPECRKQVRDLVISMVLATDMAMHFEWIGKFKNKLNGPGFNFDIRADRKLLLNMAIKCSDVNNPAKRLDQCKKWTELIMEEFFAQGDEERRRGVPVSMFMNREATDIPKCQIGFIEFIVQPLFEAWAGFMQEDAAVVMANIHNNKQYWKSRAEPQVSVVVPPTISRAMNNTTSESAAEEISIINNKLTTQQNRTDSRAISLASEPDQTRPEFLTSQSDRIPGRKSVTNIPSGPSLLATSLSVGTTPPIRNQR